MRVFVILLLLLALFCPATAAAQTANTLQPDSLNRYIRQQFDSIKLELRKAESQKLAREARQMRKDASSQMDRVVKMFGHVLTAMAIVVGVIGFVFTIAGIRLFRTSDETRKAIAKLEDELRQRGDVMLKTIEIDARKQADEKIQTLQLPPIGEPVSEDESESLREVVERLKRLEQAGGRLTAEDYVLRGRKLQGDELFDLALNAFNNAIGEDDKSASAWFGRGYCLGELRRHEEAIQAYDAALNFKPDGHGALNNKGLNLAALGRHEEAIQAYDATLKIKPNKHEALSNKGISLAKLGRREEAIQAYDAALKIKPDYDKALYNKGISLYELGRHEEAIQAFDAALKIKPDFPEALYNKARACAMIRDKPNMLASLAAAVRLNHADRQQAKQDAVFKAFRNDPDFKAIVGEG